MAKLALVLDDMLHQIGNLQLWTQNRTFDDFMGDEMVRMAIERALEVISEASRRIPDGEKDRFSDVPWPAIAAIGNILRHEYHDASEEVFWNITQGNDLNILQAALEQMNPELELKRKRRSA